MAQQIPKGMENNAVIRVRNTVPIIGVRIPPRVIPSEGSLDTKSQDSTWEPFVKISYRITHKKKHTSPVDRRSVPHSTIGASFLNLCSMVFSKAVDKIFTNQIGHQGHKE